MRLRVVLAIAMGIAFATAARTSEPGHGSQCRDLGFLEPSQSPTKEVLQLIHRLVKRTKTEIRECPSSMSVPEGHARVCGVTEMPVEKVRSRVETVFNLLGPTIRDPWRDQSGSTVGGFFFLDSLLYLGDNRRANVWAIVVSISQAGQPAIEPATVAFTVCGSGVSIELPHTP